MSASQILRRAAELVAAGWSPASKPLDAMGAEVPIFGGTTGDTARAGVNKDIVYHTMYSAIVAAAHELGGTSLSSIWSPLSGAVAEVNAAVPGGTNYLHPVLGFNVAEGRTAEQVQALLNQVADALDPSIPKSVTRLPPVTL